MVREILLWPHPLLKKKSEPTKGYSALDELRPIVTDLFDTMEHHGGVGLSAIQIGIPLNIFVAKIEDYEGQRIAFIDPLLYQYSKDKELMSEGCLSIPGIWENVSRSKSVFVSAMDEQGQYFDLQVSGKSAQIVQHEFDHLQGKMYPERLGAGAKDRLRAHMRKRAGR